MADTTRSDVDQLYGDRGMSDSDADALVSIANRLKDDVYGGRIARRGEVEGNEKDFATALGAHLFALREGGELQSESQSGGNVSFNVVAGDVEASLTETRFGRLARAYLVSEASIGIETT